MCNCQPPTLAWKAKDIVELFKLRTEFRIACDLAIQKASGALATKAEFSDRWDILEILWQEITDAYFPKKPEPTNES